jgi:alpha-tubulin suppressor-like RCC1 family protein
VLGRGLHQDPRRRPRGRKVADISAGDDHTCIRSNGDVTCWGRNSRGQLGDGTTENRASGVPVRALPAVTAVAAGGHHTCALTRTGTVQCWGSNDGAALGAGLLPAGADDGQASTVRNLTDASDLSSGDGFSCAAAGGTAQCWGAGGLGQLGDGNFVDRSLAQPASGLDDVVQVAAGSGHACARRSTGQVSCWGRNGSGQLGDGSKAMKSRPVAVDGLADAVQLAAGGEHTCAVRRAGPVLCWGKNANGQLGNGKKDDSARPVAVAGSVNQVTQLALGTDHSCALQSGRKVLCWGGNFFGQVGSGHTIGFPELLTPQFVQKVADAVELSAGDEHTCIRRATGLIACWGKGDLGQLGANITSNWSTRVPVGGVANVTALAAGRSYTCAAAPGQVMCWGNNSAGQLGNGSRSPAKVPVPGQKIGDVLRLAAGVDHTCALRSGGRVMCWGSNQRGQLGDGTTAQALAPLAVLDLP